MTIELEIRPELEEKIVAAAERRGVTVQEYVHEAAAQRLRAEPRIAEKKLSIEEFLDGMAYHGPIPEEMKTQKITREFIYGDHP